MNTPTPNVSIVKCWNTRNNNNCIMVVINNNLCHIQ